MFGATSCNNCNAVVAFYFRYYSLRYTRDNVVYLVSYYVTIIDLIALCAFAVVCDNRKLTGEMSWLGFPPHVQMSSLRFSCFCFRFGDIAPAAAPAAQDCRAMFTKPFMCVPVELTCMRVPLI